MTLQLELLAELRAELVNHDVRSELRDDLSALAVEPEGNRALVWVFVGENGRFFSWNRADRQHPVRDIAGTARRVAEHVEELRRGGFVNEIAGG